MQLLLRGDWLARKRISFDACYPAPFWSEKEVERPRNKPPDKLPLANGEGVWLCEKPHQGEEKPNTRPRKAQAATTFLLFQNCI
jgi:hypothetical protein